MARFEPMPRDDSRSPGAAAFEALFREQYAPLSEFVYRYVKSRDIAHELVQDLFLRVWELAETPDAPTITAPYLYRAARNRALKHLRHERVVTRWRAWMAARFQASEPATPAADADYEGRDVAVAVDQAIAGLPERCRLVFTMSRRQDLPYAEIAAVLGISVKTVESQMSKALKILRRKLEPYLIA